MDILARKKHELRFLGDRETYLVMTLKNGAKDRVLFPNRYEAEKAIASIPIAQKQFGILLDVVSAILRPADLIGMN